MTKKTIGVLTPHMDGFYLNVILQGIHQAALENDAHVVYFQTNDSAYTDVTYASNTYHRYLGTDYIDGWIVLLNAVTDPEYIRRFEAMGKPIVSTPYSDGFSNITTFTVDNEQGGYDATCHMIQHGHREIACVYNTNNGESVLRYQGYLRALQEHGIPVNADYIYDVPQLMHKDGVDVVCLMKQRGFGFTSAVVSADLAAIGMIEALKPLGIRVPEDIAIFSFDNIDHARIISLSSVEQPLFTRGKQMCIHLLKQTEGPYIAGEVISLQMNLVLRSSCGCKPQLEQEDIHLLYNNSLEMNDSLSNVIERNHVIGKNLIKSNAEKIKSLSWLYFTSYTWACLALWNGEKQLKIDSVYSAKPNPVLHVGQQSLEETFPPPSLQTIVDAHESLAIHKIGTEERDLGFILLIGNLFEKNRTSNLLIGSISHSLDLLAYALEREALYEEAQQREHRLEIVSSTTNDGIFDWDLTSDIMQWNRKINHILEYEGLKMHAEEFVHRMHPGDLPGFRTALHDHYAHGSPFQIEFRMLKREDEYIWILAAGEAVRNQEGKPIRMIGSIVDITERKQSEEEMHFIAYHDALTHLPNRRYIYDRIAEEVTRGSKPFAVIMLDLDRFKVINDSLGHLVGDKLLRQIASLLQSSIGSTDIVARLGGDEFLIVCTELENLLYAEAIARRILDTLNVPLDIEGHLVYATTSIGISYYPEHGADREMLIKHADIAMYRAKEAGKNRFHVYRHEMNDDSLQKLTMEGCLRGAIDAHEFELHYQPQIDLATEAVVGMEALIRWSSPVFGSVSPNEFIPLAEETGHIIPISEWVFRQACADTKQLLDEGFPPLTLSVNVSAAHAAESHFVDDVKSVLVETGLPPHLLCLEMTERAAIQRLEQTTRHLNELRELGVRIALDDFGVGNSSLSLIKTLPLDIIKIDRMFVKELPQSEISTAIFNTILGLITDLRLDSCCEGIETAEQYEFIRMQPCRLAQGYHICTPVSYQEFRSLLIGGGANRLDLPIRRL